MTALPGQSEQQPFAALRALLLPESHPWAAALTQLLQAASVGQGSLPAPSIAQAPPPELIILDHGRMLLARTAAAWDTVRQTLSRRWAQASPRHDDAQVASALDHILAPQEIRDDQGQVRFANSHQRLAVAMLVDAPVGVLTGGPGTGKTTSAAAVIALRARLEPGLSAADCLICAPTGKAANRLRQSLQGAAQRLQLQTAERELLAALRPQTIHRTLGWTPKTPEDGGPWRHNPRHPLSAQLVLVDEASMADVELFAALVAALPASAQLLILGDRDQLDSVQAGGVLAELVQRGSASELSAAQQSRLRARCGEQAVAWWRAGLPVLAQDSGRDALPGLAAGLGYSYRAQAAPWILELAEHVRPGAAGQAAAIDRCFAAAQPEQLQRLATRRACDRHCASHWQRLWLSSAKWSTEQPPSDQDLIAALEDHQLLVASNRQVARANALAKLLWQQAGDSHTADWTAIPPIGTTPRSSGPLWHGTPIILEAGASALDLANGDIGLALGSGPGHSATIACFPGQDPVPLARLPQYRPAHAITIHKSQGSEWRHVTIDLPQQAGHLLSRRLLYTAITRSSHHLALHASSNALQQLLGPGNGDSPHP